jgi:hypothetical protein
LACALTYLLSSNVVFIDVELDALVEIEAKELPHVCGIRRWQKVGTPEFGPNCVSFAFLKILALLVTIGAIEKLKPMIRSSSVKVAARMTPRSSSCSSPAPGSRLRSHEPVKEASHSVTKAAANTSQG